MKSALGPPKRGILRYIGIYLIFVIYFNIMLCRTDSAFRVNE